MHRKGQFTLCLYITTTRANLSLWNVKLLLSSSFGLFGCFLSLYVLVWESMQNKIVFIVFNNDNMKFLWKYIKIISLKKLFLLQYAVELLLNSLCKMVTVPLTVTLKYWTLAKTLICKQSQIQEVKNCFLF